MSFRPLGEYAGQRAYLDAEIGMTNCYKDYTFYYRL
jgi:hypothetical protein